MKDDRQDDLEQEQFTRWFVAHWKRGAREAYSAEANTGARLEAKRKALEWLSKAKHGEHSAYFSR